MLYEPRNRNARLYTVEKGNVSSVTQAISQAKTKFCEVTDYDKDQVRAKKVEDPFIPDIGDSMLTIVVTVRHRVYRKE
jgi:hypothetical protein